MIPSAFEHDEISIHWNFIFIKPAVFISYYRSDMSAIFQQKKFVLAPAYFISFIYIIVTVCILLVLKVIIQYQNVCTAIVYKWKLYIFKVKSCLL